MDYKAANDACFLPTWRERMIGQNGAQRACTAGGSENEAFSLVGRLTGMLIFRQACLHGAESVCSVCIP